MRGIRIKAKPEKTAGQRTLPAISLVLLLAGVFGILSIASAMPGLSFHGWVVLPLAALFSWGLWFSFSRGRKWFLLFLAAAVTVTLMMVIAGWGILAKQIDLVRQSFSGAAPNESITLLALLLAWAVSLLLFVLECLLHHHALPYLLTTALLLAAPFAGAQNSLGTVFLFLLFQIAFWALQIAAKNGRRSPFAPMDLRRAGKSGVAIVLVLILVFLAALPLAQALSPLLIRGASEAEGVVYRAILTATGQADTPITGGQINPGNHYATGTEHLTLIADRRPRETLYLRGFAGKEYLGGNWTRAEDEEALANTNSDSNLYYGQISDTMGGLYYRMFLDMGNLILNSASDPITLRVQHSNHLYTNTYVPYFGMRYWDYIIRRSESYAYRYCEQQDLDIDWNDLPDNFFYDGEKIVYIGAAFSDFFEETYLSTFTQVPREKLPRLTALVEENPLTDTNEITAFILYTLHSRATYSQTPGWSAVNQDIAEYFLFERGEGFCEHFALAATLLYRLYGVPCRYATGYAVSPDAFVEQSDGTYLASVTDDDAHAWPEIYFACTGWTPVEVTPGEGGITAASFPGQDAQKILQILNRLSAEESEGKNASTDGKDPVRPAQKEDGSAASAVDLSLSFSLGQKEQIVLFTLLGYLLLLTPLFFSQHRIWTLKRRDNADVGGSFAQILELCQFAGLLPGCTGGEEDFAARLHRALPCFSPKETERLVALATAASFGPDVPTPAELAWVRGLYRRAADAVYRRLPRWKRFLFRYGKCFG